MDFDGLVREGVITVATKVWMEPRCRLEAEEARDAREAASQNIFWADDQDENSPHDMVEETSITIKGTTIAYLIEETSTGHGNRVWAASIAACFYLFDRFQAGDDRWSEASSFQSIEFGAGAALPSLYLAHLLAPRHYTPMPRVHITDAKQYRNIHQILASVLQQPMSIREKIRIRVSPHDWGVGIGADDNDSSFLGDECDGATAGHTYDLVVASDCIYNSNYHTKLLQSISTTLALPGDKGNTTGMAARRDNSTGGRAIVTFSLHGNISDDAVWKFLAMADITRSPDGKWRLQSVPVSALSSSCSSMDGPRGGWNMEETMKELGVWVAQLEPRRWIAYLYELQWVPVEV